MSIIQNITINRHKSKTYNKVMNTASLLSTDCDWNSLHHLHCLRYLTPCFILSSILSLFLLLSLHQSQRQWKRWRAQTKSTAALSPNTTALQTLEGKILNCWLSRQSPVRTNSHPCVCFVFNMDTLKSIISFISKVNCLRRMKAPNTDGIWLPNSINQFSLLATMFLTATILLTLWLFQESVVRPSLRTCGSLQRNLCTWRVRWNMSLSGTPSSSLGHLCKITANRRQY